MKLILSQDIDNLGKKGEIVDVAAGYARNYLLPYNKGHVATQENIEMVNRRVQKMLLAEAEQKEGALAIKEKLATFALDIKAKAGVDDKLFGSVTSQEIAEALKAKGIELDKHAILLEAPIRKLGTEVLKVKLGFDIVGEVKLNVVKED